MADKHITGTVRHLFANNLISGTILDPVLIICNIAVFVAACSPVIFPVLIFLFRVWNEIPAIVIISDIIFLKKKSVLRFSIRTTVCLIDV